MLRPIYKIDGELRFCPGVKCKHYGEATGHQRKCYYESQCWRGYLDTMVAVIRLRFRRDDESNKSINGARRNKKCAIRVGTDNSSHA